MANILSEKQNFLLGTFAALVEGIILQPTVYWKNASIKNLPFTLNPRILYRGTAASILNECQMMGFQFGFTRYFQNLFIINDNNNDNINKFSNSNLLSSGLGGVTAAVIASPIELIMIQQQLYGNSFLYNISNVVRKYGFLSHGLMRGYSTTASRDFIYVNGMLSVTPITQNYLTENYNISNQFASLYASIVGGIVAALPSHPFDVAKTCLQSDLSHKTYHGTFSTLSMLYHQKRLFVGCGWRTLNIIATVFIANE
eukprot:gene16898-23188_t